MGARGEEKALTGEERFFDGYGVDNNGGDSRGRRWMEEVMEEEASKVGVHAFVACNELVGEGETWHKTSFL